MPVEVKSLEKFMDLVERASECRVYRGKGYVKLKARTKRYLYTIKLTPEAAEEAIAKLKERCSNLVEIK